MTAYSPLGRRNTFLLLVAIVAAAMAIRWRAIERKPDGTTSGGVHRAGGRQTPGATGRASDRSDSPSTGTMSGVGAAGASDEMERRVESILGLLDEGAPPATHNATYMIAGFRDRVDTNGVAFMQRLEDHAPLKGEDAQRVKDALLRVLAASEDAQVLSSILWTLRVGAERTGIDFDDEGWEIVRKASDREVELSGNTHYRWIVGDDNGRKYVTFETRSW